MSETTITLYGAHWCPDCRRSKQFLGEHKIPYNWVDIERDTVAERYVIEINDGRRIIPTIVFADGSTLTEPSNAELAAKMGLKFIGLQPNTSFLEGSGIRLTKWDFIVTGHELVHDSGPLPGFDGRDPSALETSVPGIFAAGDVRYGSTKQVASATGEGAAAALLIREYLRTV
ncbi:MAG: FAD-dependent oxidoreductase [Chloroflexi bacterium]|nr:FAD-dependent oxidoreductase [Chloroflexota bacterium]